ncbi:MAG TPA: SLC13 family permease, partial [Pseudonocardia sp.]|nr:SLC13 family permease [Pseudonocardia sp.]
MAETEVRGSGPSGKDDAGPAEREDRRSPRTVWAFRGLGLLLAALTWLALGGAEGLEPAGRVVAAIGVLMATWWMSEAIPLSATALIPIVAFPVFGVRTVPEATAPYANEIVFLFMGGFLIAIAMQKWNLHRRIALLTMRAVGTQPRRIVLGMMIATAFLSMWVSNTATTLMMLPIALSVLSLVVERTSSASGAAATEGDAIQEGTTISDAIDDRSVRVFGVGL